MFGSIRGIVGQYSRKSTSPVGFVYHDLCSDANVTRGGYQHGE